MNHSLRVFVGVASCLSASVAALSSARSGAVLTGTALVNRQCYVHMRQNKKALVAAAKLAEIDLNFRVGELGTIVDYDVSRDVYQIEVELFASPGPLRDNAVNVWTPWTLIWQSCHTVGCALPCGQLWLAMSQGISMTPIPAEMVSHGNHCNVSD